jgi:hypothetical protein
MNIHPLLNFIGKYESKNNPNAIWGGVKKVHYPKKPPTSMTIREVLAWQDSIDPFYMSEATGEWQFMEDTLRGLYREAGVTLDTKFSRETQITLAIALLKRRGLTEYLAGKITPEAFANNLAKEWASLPVVTPVKRGSKQILKGQSYYAGDGLNKAHASVDAFLGAVRAVRVPTPIEIAFQRTPPKPTVEKTVDKLITNEVGRIVRHALTPIVVGLVASGYLPQAISGPIIETAVIGATFALSLVWSKVAKR